MHSGHRKSHFSSVETEAHIDRYHQGLPQGLGYRNCCLAPSRLLFPVRVKPREKRGSRAAAEGPGSRGNRPQGAAWTREKQQIRASLQETLPPGRAARHRPRGGTSAWQRDRRPHREVSSLRAPLDRPDVPRPQPCGSCCSWPRWAGCS